MNFLTSLLDALAQSAGPWAATHLKLRSNQLGPHNQATVAAINAITGTLVPAVVGAEAAKLTGPVEKAIESDPATSEVGALIGDAFGASSLSDVSR